MSLLCQPPLCQLDVGCCKSSPAFNHTCSCCLYFVNAWPLKLVEWMHNYAASPCVTLALCLLTIKADDF